MSRWCKWRLSARPSGLVFMAVFAPGTRITASGRLNTSQRLIGQGFFVDRGGIA